MTVICLTGAPGAGKSTIGSLLAERGAAGVHVQVDFFRKQVRAGYASPHHWDDEVERQYHLARRAAAATVRIYAEAGFVVVVDDIIPIEVVPAWQDLLAGLGRKLPHYGKYSFLGFRGAELTNTVKGQWETTDSPLVEDLRPAAKRDEPLPPLALPPRPPLAELPR